VVEKSREQEHAFNCPYQLCRVPEELARRLAYRDTACLCTEYTLQLQPGDMILMYTDGLTDNLNGFEITNIINSTLEASQGKLSAAAIAEALVLAAHERSLDPTADTPFYRTARRHRQHMPGGKADDITVVIAWVEPDQEGPSCGTFGEVRLGRPHKAEAQTTLFGESDTSCRRTTMERKATQSLFPDEQPDSDGPEMQRKATMSLLPDDS
jgi:protein phosphatase PTC7